MKSAVILISGRGSNMEAILAATRAPDPLPIAVRAVISNTPGAAGLAVAAGNGVTTRVVNHREYPSREAFDAHLAAVIDEYSPDYVLLAGFMRVLTEAFVARYPARLLNIHPSLLPAFPGLHTHARALAAGVKFAGATVHFVTAQLDHGPIVAQAAVAVHPDDTEATLAARVLQAEHRLYPQALRWLATDRVAGLPGRVLRLADPRVEGGPCFSPPLDP